MSLRTDRVRPSAERAGPTRPAPSPFWDLYGRVYDAVWDSEVTRRTAHLTADLAGARPGATVVDLGCGTGLFSRAFQGEGRQVVGVDRSPVMLRRAQDRGRIGAGVQTDATATGLASGQAEVVVLANVLHVSDDPLDLLAEAIRLLSAEREARLVCVVPTPQVSGHLLTRAELDAGRSLPAVVTAQMVRAHVALLADLTGAVRRPDWDRLHGDLGRLEHVGWALEDSAIIAGCQEVRVYARVQL